jgi:hypothetical protein
MAYCLNLHQIRQPGGTEVLVPKGGCWCAAASGLARDGLPPARGRGLFLNEKQGHSRTHRHSFQGPQYLCYQGHSVFAHFIETKSGERGSELNGNEAAISMSFRLTTSTTP